MNNLGVFDIVFELGFNGIGMPDIAFLTFKTDMYYKLTNLANFTCIDLPGGFCTLDQSCLNIASYLPDYAF
jgi:hypothetical protein